MSTGGGSGLVSEKAPPSPPRRALLGVSRADYGELREAFDEQVASCEELRAQLAVADERDRARAERLDAVLSEADVFVATLDEVVSVLADVAGSERMSSELDLIQALRALLARRASSVEVARVADLPVALHEQISGAASGAATYVRETAGTAVEPHLDLTVAWAGEQAVVVRYGEGVHADGQLGEAVERLCHAAAASLEARDLSRRKGRRLAVSLLGDQQDATRFAVLSDAQGISMQHLELRIGAETYESFTGMFGEPSWDGALFDLAAALDRAARDLGGEAFEIDCGLLCAVPSHAAGAMRDAATAIIGERDVDADVVEA
jgi:hypothetical protein